MVGFENLLKMIVFHLPYDQHKPVLEKLCGLLARGGVLIYTLGNAES